MNSNILLSIIVPIYKVEAYLHQCIKSLLKQTYCNLEILLIDDGSPDLCGQICDEFAAGEHRIKVFHKDNGGNSDALNYGLQFATGDYIAFVDGDDYISNPKALFLMLEEADKTGADIIVGNYYKEIEGKLVPARDHGFQDEIDTFGPDFRFQGFYSIGHMAYTWGKLYKRSFIEQNRLTFKPYIYALDKLFNIECYLKHPKYAFIKDFIYVYRWNGASVSHQYKKDFDLIWLNISDDIYQIIKSSGKEEYLDLVAYNLLFAVFFSCKQEYEFSDRSLKAVVKELKKYRNNKLIQAFTGKVARGKYLDFSKEFLWKLLLWGISVGITLRLYWIMSLTIKLLVDFNIDGRLSSTGRAVKK